MAIGLTSVHRILMAIRLTVPHVLIAIGLPPVRCEVGTHLFPAASSSMSIDMGVFLRWTRWSFNDSPCGEANGCELSASRNFEISILLAIGLSPKRFTPELGLIPRLFIDVCPPSFERFVLKASDGHFNGFRMSHLGPPSSVKLFSGGAQRSN